MSIIWLISSRFNVLKWIGIIFATKCNVHVYDSRARRRQVTSPVRRLTTATQVCFPPSPSTTIACYVLTAADAQVMLSVFWICRRGSTSKTVNCCCTDFIGTSDCSFVDYLVCHWQVTVCNSQLFATRLVQWGAPVVGSRPFTVRRTVYNLSQSNKTSNKHDLNFHEYAGDCQITAPHFQ